VGIAACLLIALYIHDELSYDRHVPEGEQVFRVVGVNNEGGERKKGVPFPAPMARALQEDFPEIKLAGRYLSNTLFGVGQSEVRPADRVENSFESGIAYFDQSLADILQLPFLQGNPAQALTPTQAVVITERKAIQYFGAENPLGKLLIFNNDDKKPYEVTGVIKDFPRNSHLQFDFLLSSTGLEFWKDEQKDWGASNYVVYVKVQRGTDMGQLQAKVTKGIIDKYVVPMLLQTGMTLSETEKIFANAWLELQPIHDIHLRSAGIDDGLQHGDIRYVWLFGGVAVFILLIAAINFINLSTARATSRAKEVGLRKAAGSVRGALVAQFLTESVVLSGLSFVGGAILAWTLLPFFNEVAGKVLAFPWQNWWLLPLLAGLALLVGLLAGLYPAFYLSAFQPAQVLKGQLTRGRQGGTLRSSLVVFQFTASIVLLVSTAIIYRQMNFILNKELGFHKEQVLLIEGANNLGKQVTAFKQELQRLPFVSNTTVTDYLPIKGMKRNGNSFWHEGKVQSERPVIAQFWRVDTDYLATLGMELVAGRDFDPQQASDSAAVIVNETLLRQLGGESILGTRISNGAEPFTVIGVVRDFHFEDMKQNIEGLCLALGHSPAVVAVRMQATDVAEALTQTQALWRQLAPQQAFRFSFLDERFAAMYRDVARMGKLFTAFAVLAMSVACLGLFALSAYLIEQRSKEISIRLILGAPFGHVLVLLTRNYLKLVVIALAVASPLGWYLMKNWLEDFAYRTEMSWEVFAVAGVVALTIAVLTVLFQSAKAARANPVQNLRSE
jgi:putative ABC transport system permease protein